MKLTIFKFNSKLIILGLMFFVSCLFLIFNPSEVLAALDNSLVIDEGVYYNRYSMNEAEIQSFLVEKNSYLKNYTEPNDVYIGPSVNVKGWSASKIIYNCAIWNGLSPKVILVTLQKEQSLITNSVLLNGQSSLDGAMGYGYLESGITLSVYKGFSMQVAWGSFGLKKWSDYAISHSEYNDFGTTKYWVDYPITIDGQTFIIKNGPTAALYRYTPHIQTSFYLIFTNFFSTVNSDGPYLIVNENNPTGVYLVDNNKKYPIPANIFNSWGFNTRKIYYITEESFNSYTTSLVNLTKLININGHVYFIDRGSRLGIVSPEQFNLWGFNWDDIIILNTINSYTLNDIGSLSQIIRKPESGKFYFMDNGILRYITNPELISQLGYPKIKITDISSDINFILGNNFSSFIVKGSSGLKYIIDDGNKKLISDQLIAILKLEDYNITILDDSSINFLSIGSNVNPWVSTKGLNGYYLIDGGEKRPANKIEINNSWGYPNNYTNLPLSTINTYPTGEPLTQLALYSGSVYLAQEGKLRPINDSDTFNIFKDNWGLGWGDIKKISTDLFNYYNVGVKIYFPRIVTYSYGGSVFFMDIDGKRPINSIDTFNNFGFIWNNIFYTKNNNFLLNYPSPNRLTRLVSNRGSIYLIENKTKRPISSAQSFINHSTFDPLYRWEDVVPISDYPLSLLQLGEIIY